MDTENNTTDTEAIKQLGLTHVRNAYNKINKEKAGANINGQDPKTKKQDPPQDQKRLDPNGQLDLHHAVRLIKAGFIMYYQKRDLPLYLKQVINPFIDLWEISAHTIVDKYAKDMALGIKPEYVCFGGGALLALDPILQHRKGKLKDMFNPPQDPQEKKTETPESGKNFTPEIIDYDLPN